MISKIKCNNVLLKIWLPHSSCIKKKVLGFVVKSMKSLKNELNSSDSNQIVRGIKNNRTPTMILQSFFVIKSSSF